MRTSRTSSSIRADTKTARSRSTASSPTRGAFRCCPFKFYRVDDGTGQIAVLSESLRMPGKGEHVRVKGRVGNVAVLGGRSLGLHLREEHLDVRRR